MGIITGMEKIDVPVELLVLDKAQISEVITYADIIKAEEEAWQAYGNNEVEQPQKQPIYVGPPDKFNMCLAMPAYLKKIGPKGNLGTIGVKWATDFFSQMPGIPTLWGCVLVLNQADNGQPFAIMDATSITNIRTAGHSAVAAKYLAKKDSQTMAIIGCGAEGRTHAAAFKELFPIKTIRAYDVRDGVMEDFKQEIEKALDVEVTLAGSAKEAVEGVDIICMCTNSDTTVVHESWVPAGCFVAGITMFSDLDTKLSSKADKWVVGYQSSDEHFLGILSDPEDTDKTDIHANMGEITTGAKEGRENDQERIIYTHAGAAILDIAVGVAAFNNAVEKGIGTKLKLV